MEKLYKEEIKTPNAELLEELLEEHKVATEKAGDDRWNIVRKMCPRIIDNKVFEWLKDNYVIHKK